MEAIAFDTFQTPSSGELSQPEDSTFADGDFYALFAGGSAAPSSSPSNPFEGGSSFGQAPFSSNSADNSLFAVGTNLTLETTLVTQDQPSLEQLLDSPQVVGTNATIQATILAVDSDNKLLEQLPPEDSSPVVGNNLSFFGEDGSDAPAGDSNSFGGGNLPGGSDSFTGDASGIPTAGGLPFGGQAPPDINASSSSEPYAVGTNLTLRTTIVTDDQESIDPLLNRLQVIGTNITLETTVLLVDSDGNLIEQLPLGDSTQTVGSNISLASSDPMNPGSNLPFASSSPNSDFSLV